MHSRRARIGASPIVRRAADTVRPLYRRVNPWTGLGGLDKKIFPLLPRDGSVFVEAGANDGIKQSNTLALERRFGWSGLLIEPVPRLADACARNRPGSRVENVALVSTENEGTDVEILDLDLMSSVAGHRSFADEQSAIKTARGFGVEANRVEVRGVCLSTLLDDVGIARVDFLSLDVEGYELEVLRGLALNRHAPRVILVETANADAVADALGADYRTPVALTEHDYVFQHVSLASI